ncbi:MAG: hypothetical protein LBK99_24970 [Opitutaceae bacterium]|jgi:hypothetical protein|nr:hypothetical protein [Opitutaceae bacterium]
MTTNKIRFIRSLSGALVLLLVAPVLIQAQNLITNGDFEGQTMASWTTSNYSQNTPTNASVVNTTSLDDYALTLNRPDEAVANPPGVSQTFTIAVANVSSLLVSFDYTSVAGTDTKLLFRIYAGNSYYGTYTASSFSYYSATDSGWKTASFSDRNAFSKRDWGTNASGTTNYNNLAANTVVLSATSASNNYSLLLDLLDDASTYTIEFFNPVRNSTIAIDNITVTPIPEPATLAFVSGLIALPIALFFRCKHRKT